MYDSEFVQVTDAVGDLVKDVWQIVSAGVGKVSEIIGLFDHVC